MTTRRIFQRQKYTVDRLPEAIPAMIRLTPLAVANPAEAYDRCGGGQTYT